MEENNWCVYKHTTPSGKVYIGITSQKIELRWRNGKGYKTQVFNHAIEKYGWDNIIHEVLFENLSHKDACAKEIELIEKYKSNDSKYGYNVTSGGDGTIGIISVWRGKHLPKETCIKISESNKGKVPTLEARKRMSNSQKKLASSPNYINPMQGKKHSDQTKAIISHCHKGRKLSDEHKKKLSEAGKGRIVSNETRKKLSESAYNRFSIPSNNPKAKKVDMFDNNLNYIKTFSTMLEASLETGICKSNISRCCRRGAKTAGGYIWRYADEEGEYDGKDISLNRLS